MLSRRAMMNDEIVRTEGKNLALQKCKGSYLHGLNIYGYSTQETTTGAQLFDASQIKDGFVSLENIGGTYNFFSNSTYPNSQYCELILPDGVTNISWDFSNCTNSPGTNNGDNGFRIRLSDENNICTVRDVNLPIAKNDFSIPEGTSKLYFMGIAGFSENVGEVAVVNAGNTRQPWEPYTGGLPSPSPENPEPIISAGTVMTTGAQLYNVNAIGGIFPMEADEYGYYTLDLDNSQGTSEAYKNLTILPSDLIESNTEYAVVAEVEEISGCGLYPISDASAGAVDFVGQIGYPVEGIIATGTRISVETSIDDMSIADCMLRSFIAVPAGQVGHCKFRLSVIKDTTVTTETFQYEPYTGGVPGVNPIEGQINIQISGGTQSQSLTTKTPGGLPGIPVSADGNYTDENGQQWVCDEIDFGRGVYVQRIQKAILNGTETWNAGGLAEDLSDRYWERSTVTDGVDSAYSPVLCSDYRSGVVANNNNNMAACVLWGRIRIRDNSFSDIAAWKEHLQEHNITIYYILGTPIETELSVGKVAAYKALHTYTPNTTVSNDAEAWMKVGYRKVRG